MGVPTVPDVVGPFPVVVRQQMGGGGGAVHERGQQVEGDQAPSRMWFLWQRAKLKAALELRPNWNQTKVKLNSFF